MNDITSLDYLLVGHIAHDKTKDGPRLGGTVAYTAVVAQALGLRVGIVTSCRPDEPVLAALPDVALHCVPSEQSTVFVNRYDAQGNRQQIIRSQAAVLTYDDIPPAWRDASIVHFAPIARELGPDLSPQRFSNAIVGMTPQGEMRRWDDAGHVYPSSWGRAAMILQNAVVVLSDEDLGHDAALEADYAAQSPLLVVTRGYLGATLYRNGMRTDIPAPGIRQLGHPTGAGDTFAAAFFAYLYHPPHDADYAVRAATLIASTYVESELPEGVLPLAKVKQLLQNERLHDYDFSPPSLEE